MFIDNIYNDVDSSKQQFIKQLKSENLPIIIYGAQNIGHTIYNYLADNDLRITGFCVDTQYLNSSISKYNIDLFLYSELDEKFDAYNLIIGFGNGIKAYNIMHSSSLKNCCHTYIFPFYDPMPPMSYSFIENNCDKFECTYNLLNDMLSKKIMIAFLNSKLGNIHGNQLLNLWDINQYFNDLTLPFIAQDNFTFVDCGAFTGDTIMSLNSFAKDTLVKVFAFEPDVNNLNHLKNMITLNKIKNVTIVPKATWSTSTTLHFNNSGTSSSSIKESGTNLIQTITIDEVVQNTHVSFIKMDVEGSELASLMGAENTIKHSMPVLAICVYHKPEDLITIPQYISRFENESYKYQFYLRHHCHTLTETVLYALPVHKN